MFLDGLPYFSTTLKLKMQQPLEVTRFLEFVIVTIKKFLSQFEAPSDEHENHYNKISGETKRNQFFCGLCLLGVDYNYASSFQIAHCRKNRCYKRWQYELVFFFILSFVVKGQNGGVDLCMFRQNTVAFITCYNKNHLEICSQTLNDVSYMGLPCIASFI